MHMHIRPCAENALSEDLRNKAKYVLEELQPPVASDETIQATRDELVANAEVSKAGVRLLIFA